MPLDKLEYQLTTQEITRDTAHTDTQLMMRSHFPYFITLETVQWTRPAGSLESVVYGLWYVSDALPGLVRLVCRDG